ncbi:SMAD/FHA domain-containing protein [Mucor lusitanicus]|uniref:SMAD/FHA domain-containing protein n=1 Tax=Mucor circinelloides f. lusitanicus TaxID=29924 RepID=A0A8H4BRX2_MUCCL|nr:SMAD/FHA domain-containing protein [Mucor lusitanicus]
MNTPSGTRPTSDSSIIAPEHQTTHIRIVPSIENPSRSLVFSIIERDLEAGRIIKIGRFTDRSSIQNHISFKSKVVSRSHCEIWLNSDGKVQLKDTKSSSGTFVNHVRLSPANTESRPVEIRDGDLVQLGVDYQGGYEEIYRSVKMRFEVNRPNQPRPVSYSMSAFNNLRNLTSLPSHTDQPQQQQQQQQQQLTTSPLSSSLCHEQNVEVEECCICLYALAPFQALFVAPCSHSYHFKCIRPLFDSYPGFQCPICRTYSDLDASVAIEAEEVIEKFGLRKSSTSGVATSPVIAAAAASVNAADPPLSTTLVACTTSLSGIISSPTSSSNVPILENQGKIQSFFFFF